MTVFRDPWGIPHIRATSLGSLAFEQGRVTARDRAWQLEIERLRGEGRTAELLGQPGVEWDTFARRARIAPIAQMALASLDTETNDFLSSYADGVNSAFADGVTAPEFVDLDSEPGTWQPWSPLAVFLVQHILFGAFPSKLFSARARAALGEDADLFRTEGLSGGSNAYAVGGERTVNGRPIIAGDPHRLFEVPNIYAQVRLSCPDFDVLGFAFPGVPGVQHFGHAGSVAWAVTNAMADYQDLHVLLPDDAVVRTIETIEVRHSQAVEIETLTTPRGPVVLGDPSAGTALILQMPAHDLGDLGFGALLPLLRSRTVADVDAALERWVEPVNNVVIAGDSGRVLHRVAGTVPVRDASGVWTGWVRDLPRTEVAPDGFVVTANDRSSTAYDVLSRDFAPPFRAERIRELLSSSPPLGAVSAGAVLADVQQRQCLDLLALVPEGLRPDWDGEMDNSEGAAWFAALRARVVERICAAPALAALREPSPQGPLFEPWFALDNRVASALHVILAADRPFGIEVRALVEDVAAGLPASVVPSPHRFHPLHALEQFGIRHERTTPDSALPGDSETVNANRWLPGTDLCVRGPVARYVWHLGDRQRSRWVVPLGAAGDPASSHHADQHQVWAAGSTVPVITAWELLTEERPWT
jgi:penicillin amidase